MAELDAYGFLCRVLGLLPALGLTQVELSIMCRLLSYPGARVDSRAALRAGDSERPALPFARSGVNKAVDSLLRRGLVERTTAWRNRGAALQVNRMALLDKLAGLLAGSDRALRA